MSMRTVAVWVLVGLLGSGAGGCASNRSKYPNSRAAYDAGAYSDALTLSQSESSKSRGARQEEAELIAGMSARNLNKLPEAERHLKPLTTSADKAIAGRASAEMGIIEAQRGHHEASLRYFDDAGDKLEGDDAARAMFQAGESAMAAGRTEMARLQYRRALERTSDPTLRNTIESRLSLKGFTLQVGAFASRINADKAVTKAMPVAQRLKIEAPRVLTRVGPNGRDLFVVQMGTFTSERDAQMACKRAGAGVVVARVTGN